MYMRGDSYEFTRTRTLNSSGSPLELKYPDNHNNSVLD